MWISVWRKSKDLTHRGRRAERKAGEILRAAWGKDAGHCMTMLVASSATENKQKNRACARLVRVDPAENFAEQLGDYWPEGGEDGDADSNDAGKGLRS
jgi:hypothetical protein